MKIVVYILMIGFFVTVAKIATRPLTYAPGVLIPLAPEQTYVAYVQPIMVGGLRLQPMAKYAIRARVLAKTRYRFSDPMRELSPFDLAVGWRSMSDQAILDRLEITQDERFYNWHYEGAPPLQNSDIIFNSSNMHLIPKNDEIFDRINSLSVGSIIYMTGYLVEVFKDKTSIWKSSVSRTDTGLGACELMYVEGLNLLDTATPLPLF